MEKERKIKTLSLVALIVAVLGLTVAFAALSQTLTINGSASVNAAEWDIHFENINKISSYEGSFNSEPVLNGTSISNLNVTITKPGDSAALEFDIKNTGTINAKISSIEISKLCTLQSSVESCDWNNDGEVTQEDIDKVNDNISYIVVYCDDNINNGYEKELKVNDTLNAGSIKHAYVGITYSKVLFSGDIPTQEEATELPKRNLTFNDLSVTINYVQAD